MLSSSFCCLPKGKLGARRQLGGRSVSRNVVSRTSMRSQHRQMMVMASGEVGGTPAEVIASAPRDVSVEATEAAAASPVADTAGYQYVPTEEREEEAMDLLPDDEVEASASVSIASLWDRPLVKGAAFSVAAFLGITFAISVYKAWVIYNSSTNKRKRTVDKNLMVVEALNKWCPGNRSGLTSAVIRDISSKTGFSKDSVFRKCMRYILNERPFDNEAVADIMALRAACSLSDKEVALVIKEIAERTFKKTGILMRRPKGMTADGLARKVQGRAIFSKILYLAEMEGLIPAEERDAVVMTLFETFGATSDDAASLRISSLSEVTVDDLERLWRAGGRDILEEEQQQGESAADGGAQQEGAPPPPPAAGGAGEGEQPKQ